VAGWLSERGASKNDTTRKWWEKFIKQLCLQKGVEERNDLLTRGYVWVSRFGFSGRFSCR